MVGLVEEWRQIRGFSGYEISSFGRVRSLPRTVTYRNRWGSTTAYSLRGRFLKAQRGHSDGSVWYWHVSLSRRAQLHTVRVHVLVLRAFTGPKPHGKEGAHIDGNLSNNAAANLAWKTPKENAADKAQHGTARGRYSK